MKCISDYFSRKNCEPVDTEDSIFCKFLTTELAKIQDKDIKHRVKRKLTDTVFDAIEEDAKKLKPQPHEIHYVLLADGTLQQIVNTPEA